MGQSLLERASFTLVSVNIPPADAEIERVVARCRNFSVRSLDGILMMENPPSNQERSALSSRQRMLAGSMDHDRKTVAMLIAQMLNCYANPIKENETAEQVVALYVRELGIEPKCPTWAVSQAVGQIRLGQAPGISFVHRPSTIAVRRIADGFAWKAKAEIVNIADVLKGQRAIPQLSPEEREEVATEFRKFADAMIARNSAREETDHMADVAKLTAIVGDKAFAAIPNAKKRRGSVLGREAGKIVMGGRR